MKTGVKVKGAKARKRAVDDMADGIEQIFKAAAKHNMDQDTVRHAITELRQVGTPNTPYGTTISHSSFSG